MTLDARALVASVGVLVSFPLACDRHAEVREEPKSVFKPPPMLKANLHEVDSGLGTDAFPACAERPVGRCVGPIDLPCGFSPWVSDVAKRCAREGDCRTNGTLEVRMSSDGCVVGISMDQPNDAFVKCVADEVGHASCPCGAGKASYFLGLGNYGCTPCSKEFPCKAGEVCMSGRCEPVDAGDGGS